MNWESAQIWRDKKNQIGCKLYVLLTVHMDSEMQ